MRFLYYQTLSIILYSLVYIFCISCQWKLKKNTVKFSFNQSFQSTENYFTGQITLPFFVVRSCHSTNILCQNFLSLYISPVQNHKFWLPSSPLFLLKILQFYNAELLFTSQLGLFFFCEYILFKSCTKLWFLKAINFYERRKC